jgi:hypothetical protein
MLKQVLFLYIIFIFSCRNIKLFNNRDKSIPQKYSLNMGEAVYKIYKIDSINNYYLLYASRNDSLYKIVSQKETISNCQQIIVNQVYALKLHSIWKHKLLIGSVDVSPSAIYQVTCLAFNDSTKICIERDSINDLHYADNIRGLCFMKGK